MKKIIEFISYMVIAIILKAILYFKILELEHLVIFFISLTITKDLFKTKEK